MDRSQPPAVSCKPRACPRVVIIGGGFAGLAACRALSRAPVDITLIDRTNHYLFQPLLYQVATAALAPSDISAPIRYLVRKQKNVLVLLGEVTEIDKDLKAISVEGVREPIPFDYLIVATGSRHAYFGHDEWEKYAPGLKSLYDAINIRQKFLLAFEQAEKTDDPADRAAWMTFAIVGGGPTGVELAGVLYRIAVDALEQDFRRIDTAKTRVILLEGGDRLLPTFPPKLSATARRDLEALGVTVRTKAPVTRVEADAVYLGEERIPTRTVIWAAGNMASPLARKLGVPLDNVGRVLVEPDLSVPGYPEIFVAGDLAHFEQPNRKNELVPGVAPAAMQMGKHAAKNIVSKLAGGRTSPFHYWNKGNLAVIGRGKAIADFRFIKVTGRLAWWLWLFIHILYLADFRNRLIVLVQWAYAYVTYQQGVRLITRPDPE